MMKITYVGFHHHSGQGTIWTVGWTRRDPISHSAKCFHCYLLSFSVWSQYESTISKMQGNEENKKDKWQEKWEIVTNIRNKARASSKEWPATQKCLASQFKSQNWNSQEKEKDHHGHLGKTCWKCRDNLRWMHWTGLLQSFSEWKPPGLLPMEFSRWEYWRGLPFASPGELPEPGIELSLLHYRQILHRWSHQGSNLDFQKKWWICVSTMLLISPLTRLP